MAKTGVARRWRLRLAALLIVAALVALLRDVAPHPPARRIVRAAAPAVSSRGVSSAASASMSSLLPSASWESVGGTSVGLCNGTMWTLHQLTRCPPPRQLHCFNGYASASNHRHSQWNAFTHIRPLLLSAGYNDCLDPSGSASSIHPISPPAHLFLVPNYWFQGASDWRELRLKPWQRINRLWGSHVVSKKLGLVRTLREHFGDAGCPFFPPSYLWEHLQGEEGWEGLIQKAPRWILKREIHRGQGLSLASSADLLDPFSELRLELEHSHHEVLVQQYIARPLLINGHKLTLRLYSVITGVSPLRVYAYDDGFALFAAEVYSPDASEARSYITNAFVNQRGGGGSHRATEAVDGVAATVAAGGADAAGGAAALARDSGAAAALGLPLPPEALRWRVRELRSFLEARSGGGSAIGATLERSLQRLILHTWVSARASMMAASESGLRRLGLGDAYQYANSFELTGFDVLIDQDLRPWLIEINTTPSLASLDTSEREYERDGALKKQMLHDLLNLADAVPEEEPPPEAQLELLMRRNQLRSAGVGRLGCVRPWRLGGCKYCPNEAELGELRRCASEERRSGAFAQLAPSIDPEWVGLVEGGRWQLSDERWKLNEQTGTRDGRAPIDELLREWLRLPAGDAQDGNRQCDAGCVAARWDGLLCPAT